MVNFICFYPCKTGWRFHALFSLLIILILPLSSLWGQCIAGGNENVFVGCDAEIQSMNAKGPFLVRIYIHIIRKSDGTGGITDEEVQEGIDFLKSAYNEHDIFFIWDCVINEIESDNLYNAGSTTLSTFFTTTEFTNNFNPDGIDIYIFPDRIGDALGFAKSVPGIACLTMGNHSQFPYAPNSRSHIISHEVGHCLGLLHTHHHTGDDGFPTPSEAWRRTGYELADGSNGDVAGDCIDDTPADPNINGQVPYPSCQWIGSALDNENNPILEVSEENIMSYTNPSCMTELTPEQGRRARNILATQEILQLSLVKEKITSNETWDLNNVPGGVVYQEGDLIIESGASLNIKSGITVQFNPNARLIIKPNANVYLEGTLTNNACDESSCPNQCGETWKGVRVWGDTDKNQYIEGGIRHQGRLIAREGSMIENAEVGVQLWGPVIQLNAGGILHAYKATFKNNLLGIDFAPYENISPTTSNPTNYFGVLAQCDFITDSDYPHTENDFAFVNMVGVRGVSIRGCDFTNTRNNPPGLNSIVDFGIGIKGSSASFTIKSDCTQPTIPCPSYVENNFSGLGYGVSLGLITLVAGTNDFANIQGVNFDQCFVGVEIRSFNNVTIALNDFNMGVLPNTTLDVDQVGIYASNNISALNIQENTFIQSLPNANLKTVGISCLGLGPSNNIIRKNTFNGLNIGNEAGGNNGNTGSGLLYQCNTNINITEYDFLLCDTEFSDGGTINEQQKEADPLLGDLASGNKFANTGIQTYRDFSNETSGFDLEYFYKTNGGILEIPDEYIGITILTQADENACPSRFCAPPCDSESEITSLKDDFFTYRADRNNAAITYQTAQNNGDTLLMQEAHTALLSHQQLMDFAAQRVLIHTKIDTLNYSLDSVRTWLSLSETLSAELELALTYFNRGDTTSANNILANAPQKFNLSASELIQLSDLESFFSQIHGKSVFEISSTDIHFLEVLAQKKEGLAGSIARNILSLYHYHYPPENCISVLGESPKPRSADDNLTTSIFKVYPNPASQFTTFEWEGQQADLWIMDATGRVIHRANIEDKYVWTTAAVPSGIYFYQIRGITQLTGRILINH